LLRKGLLGESTRAVRRDPLAHRSLAPSAPLALTAQQHAAYTAILAALHDAAERPAPGAGGAPAVFLLHGVTGSGKTEVYLQALAATFALQRQAYVLVPEISLTPQTIARFAARFPGQMALLHSGLGQGERHDEWERLRRGAARAVVGARSAIFAPLANPGLIILDEEHDASYKQSSGVRYHTRDVAVELARLTGAVVVLGSATPDVGTYRQAISGLRPTIRLLEMPHRVATSGLPPVQVVDLRQELRAGNRSIFSRALGEAVRGSLERGEQAILYINRRGAASFVICRDCGYVVQCHACDLPFTYHSATRELICHRCDARAVPPETCVRCQSWRIRYFGLGTQKVEEEAAQAFPGARLLRWDRDVAAGKHGHETVLDRFASHGADILIGTQMVAKGLDIPLVTTVGVVSADTALNLPDFRAAERAFQLLTQVAGRAGRAADGPARPGRVVIQTYTPEHFAIQAAAGHDYAAFYRDEIAFRAEACYPPFARLLRLLYAHRNESRCSERAHALAAQLREVIAAQGLDGTEVVGPAPCFVSKIRHSYQWQVLVRGDVDAMLPHVPQDWTRDVDPVSLL
jgi:primosomal protein N' (replication factor Y)